MTVINTNTASINAHFNLNKVNQEMEKAMEQLSSGNRINSAADDAAGLSIATRMESQVRGLNQAMRNAADGQSMVDTAEGAMGEMTNMLQRMRELSLQAANGSNNDVDRSALNSEVDQLKAEIDRIVSTTTFNGKSLLDGEMNSTLQIGVNAGETLDFNISNMSTAALGSLSGAAPASGITSAQFSGVAAESTVTQLRFDGTDTYTFELSMDLGNTTGANNVNGMDTFEISASVAGNDASDVTAAINAAIRDTVTAANGGQEAPGNAARFVNVTSVGSVVTIENMFGGDISVGRVGDKHISEGGGKIAYTSINADDNANNPSDNTVLGSNETRKVSFTNGGGDAGAGVSGTAEVQALNVLTNLGAIEGQFSTGALKLTIGEYELFADASADTNAADLLASIDAHADNTATLAAMDADGIALAAAADSGGTANALLTVSWTEVGDQRAVTLSNVTEAVSATEDTAGVNEVSTLANFDRVTFSGLDVRADKYTFTDGTAALEVEMTGVPSMSKLANLLNDAAVEANLEVTFSEDATGVLMAKANTPGTLADPFSGAVETDFVLTQGVTNEVAVATVADLDLTNENDYTISVTGRGSVEFAAATYATLDDMITALNGNATFQDFELEASADADGDLVITSTSGQDEAIGVAVGGGDLILDAVKAIEGGADIDVEGPAYTLGSVTKEYVDGSDTDLTLAAAEVQTFALDDVTVAHFSEMVGTGMSLSIGGQTLTVNLQNWIDSQNNGQNLADVDDLAQAIQDAAGYGSMDWEVTSDGTDTLSFTWKEAGPVTGEISIDGLYAPLVMSDAAAAGGTPGVDAVPGNEDLAGAIMTISPDRADSYSFALDGNAISYTFDGTANGLENFATHIANTLNGADGAGSWTAEASNGTIEIAKLDAAGFSLTGFSSVGSGRLSVANWDGQAPSNGEAMVILDDTRVDTSATTEGAGFATETKVSMTFDANDIYSFNITDGVATAVINSVGTGTEAGSGDIGDLAVAIETALQRSGLHTAVSVELGADENELILTHSLGSRLDITNFKSEKSGVAEVRGVANTDGYAKFLDDGGSVEDLARVSEINLGTADGAESALDIIDRALEDITAQRATLGAISNRLDHTISNLGNIVVNTEASQSRIEDADFAKVTGDLTKAQIMSQAATAMLAQANASKQGVLSLLQG